jgi:hypothetical protein
MAKFIFISAILLAAPSIWAEETIYLFGKKPVNITVGKDGVETQRGGGFICDLAASLGDAKYSEWGKTESDARNIVHKKCSDKSGLLICKKDRVTCREDK